MSPESRCVYEHFRWLHSVDRLVGDVTVGAEDRDIVFCSQFFVHHLQHLVVADSVFLQHELVCLVHDVEVVQSVSDDGTDVEVILFGQLFSCLFIDVCSHSLLALQPGEFVSQSYFGFLFLALVELAVDDVPSQFCLGLYLVF